MDPNCQGNHNTGYESGLVQFTWAVDKLILINKIEDKPVHFYDFKIPFIIPLAVLLTFSTLK